MKRCWGSELETNKAYTQVKWNSGRKKGCWYTRIGIGITMHNGLVQAPGLHLVCVCGGGNFTSYTGLQAFFLCLFTTLSPSPKFFSIFIYQIISFKKMKRNIVSNSVNSVTLYWREMAKWAILESTKLSYKCTSHLCKCRL